MQGNWAYQNLGWVNRPLSIKSNMEVARGALSSLLVIWSSRWELISPMSVKPITYIHMWMCVNTWNGKCVLDKLTFTCMLVISTVFTQIHLIHYYDDAFFSLRAWWHLCWQLVVACSRPSKSLGVMSIITKCSLWWMPDCTYITQCLIWTT